MRKLFVHGTPTIIYFKKGQEVERVVGLHGELYHQEFIDHELLDNAQGDTGGERQSRTG